MPGLFHCPPTHPDYAGNLSDKASPPSFVGLQMSEIHASDEARDLIKLLSDPIGIAVINRASYVQPVHLLDRIARTRSGAGWHQAIDLGEILCGEHDVGGAQVFVEVPA